MHRPTLSFISSFGSFCILGVSGPFRVVGIDMNIASVREAKPCMKYIFPLRAEVWEEKAGCASKARIRARFAAWNCEIRCTVSVDTKRLWDDIVEMSGSMWVNVWMGIWWE